VLAARQLAQRTLESILVLARPLGARTCCRLRGGRRIGFRDLWGGRRISVSGLAGGAHHDRLTAAWAHDPEPAPVASRATNGTVAPGALDLNQIFGIN
jgi:hypothetical protein